jgi:thioredoxin
MALAAYLDESGDKDTPILSVGGYVATGEEWRRFSRDWVSFLQANGIHLFHMVDLEGGNPPFSGWERKRRDDLFKELTEILNSRVIFQTWAAVNVKECEGVITECDKDMIASPYVFCGVYCLLLISNWARTHWKEEHVVMFFEGGRPFSGDMFRLLNRAVSRPWLRERYKIAAIRKGSKKELVPLQAADCLAYEVGKKYSNPTAPIRPYLKWLDLGNRKSKGRFFASAEIKDFIRMVNDDFDQLVNQYDLMIVDCWAPWCGPCQMMTPIVDELAKSYAGKIVFGKLNVDENPLTAGRFGVMSIPTLLVMKKGREIDRVIGAAPRRTTHTCGARRESPCRPRSGAPPGKPCPRIRRATAPATGPGRPARSRQRASRDRRRWRWRCARLCTGPELLP